MSDIDENSTEDTAETPAAAAKSGDGGFGETVRTVLYALAIALVVRTFAFEPFSIPSGSMRPTLLEGDYLFVSKYTYGYSRYSLPLGLPLIPGRILLTAPERGDVAVFKLPSDPSVDYIKRVIGLPGDTIQVVAGVLHINGKAVVRERVDDFVLYERSGNVTRRTRYLETLPNGVTHYILEWDDERDVDNTPPYVVPAGHLFMMGDNRDNSRDSRYRDVGFVPLQNLVGKAQRLFFSIDGDAWRVWDWPSWTRTERLFQAVK